MAHDIFISYSSPDRATAEAICAALESRNISCWFAPRDVAIGKVWVEAIVDAIDASRIFILVLSSSSNSSPQVNREVERAASKGIPIIPIRIDNTPLSKSIDFFTSRHQWLDAQTPPLEKHLPKLVATVQQLLAQEASAVAEKEAEESRARAKREAEAAKKIQEAAARAKKEAEGAVKERARQEAVRARAKREAEAARKIQGAAARAKKEAEESRVRAKREAEAARKIQEAAARAKKEVEAFRERAKQEAEAAKGIQATAARGRMEAKPKPIPKPHARMPLRPFLIGLGAALLGIASVGGIYFTFGHLFTPSPTLAIQDVSVSDITATSAVLTWTTDKPATSQVAYGYTADLGLTTALGEELVTNHRVELTGLQPDTTCHFRVMSKNASGKEATSDIGQLTTLPAATTPMPTPSPPPPVEKPVEPPPAAKLSFNATEYTNAEYGFSIKYPSDWIRVADEEKNEIKLYAKGTGEVPVISASVRGQATFAEAVTAAFGPRSISRTAIKVDAEQETTLEDGTKATTAKVDWENSSGYLIESYALGVKKGNKWILVTISTVSTKSVITLAPYDEAKFSEIAHTLRFTAEE
ncbi:MAG: TIR domain-containing protein [Chloroflexi bacterium]|nr:TIR domain-containing protein [Chloroflexota bacterium]